MNKHVTRLFLGLLISLTALAASAAPSEVQSEANGSFIFLFNDSVESSEITGLAVSLATSYNGSLRYVYTSVLKGFSAEISYDDADRLVTENDEVDTFVSNGVARFNAAGGAKNGVKFTADEVTSWGAELITSRDATADGKTRHAWIIDTGIDDYYDGVELDIGEGRNFVIRGKNKTVADIDPNATDDVNGHGTHIAGILAAKDNDTGVLGIAAGATVHPVRVLHKNLWGTTDAILAGLIYVKNRIDAFPGDIHVVNMSLTVEIDGQAGPAGLIDEVINTITANGSNDIKFAVCAGNDSSDASLYTPSHLSISNANVFTIASINEELALAPDSNTGNNVSFVAPGVAIESLKPGGGTWFWSGCSMATPHVAGILLFQNPVQNGTVDGYPQAGF